MTHHENLKIIAFVGLPGSGKTSAVNYLTGKSIPKVYFGGVVLQEVRERGLDITPENEQFVREDMRSKEGDDVIVQRIIKQIHNLNDAGQHRIVADGLYSWTEYKILKQAFPAEVSIVAIVSPRITRHKRLAEREDRPLTREQASARDWAEIEHLEKGGPIANADAFILNDGSIEDFWLKTNIRVIS
jgi:dephospho-CoA kinase